MTVYRNEPFYWHEKKFYGGLRPVHCGCNRCDKAYEQYTGEPSSEYHFGACNVCNGVAEHAPNCPASHLRCGGLEAAWFAGPHN